MHTLALDLDTHPLYDPLDDTAPAVMAAEADVEIDRTPICADWSTPAGETIDLGIKEVRVTDSSGTVALRGRAIDKLPASVLAQIERLAVSL